MIKYTFKHKIYYNTCKPFMICEICTNLKTFNDANGVENTISQRKQLQTNGTK